MEKKNDRNKNTSQNKLYSDEIKEMERLSEEQEKALRERRQARKTSHKKAGTKKKTDRIGKHGRCYRSGSSECSHRNRQFCDQRKQAKSGFIKKISRKGLIGADFDRYGETESFRSGSG